MAVSLSVNGKSYSVDVPPQMPLLWVLRDVVGLTGTKFGCGMALCGACTVHVNGVAQRSCMLPKRRSQRAHLPTFVRGFASRSKHRSLAA